MSNRIRLSIDELPSNHAPVLAKPAVINYIDTAVVDNFYSSPTIGSLVASDVDPNTTLTYGIAGGMDYGDGNIVMSNTYGQLTVNTATGDYSFAPYSGIIEPLKTNATDTFTVTVSDGQLSTSKILTINITQSGSTESIGNDMLTGTTGNDLFNGLAGNDTINGLTGDDTIDGGAGADRMTGGKGNDTYYVDNVRDKVIERAGKGVDTVYSTISYTLSANVENLSLNLERSSAPILIGTGNALDNYLKADGRINITAHAVLDGQAGDDILDSNIRSTSTLLGGEGNDLYYVYNVGDVVKELAGEGVDTVSSSIVSYTLTANVENLILRNGPFGDIGISGTGNALDNQLTGDYADNILNGLAGNDVLIGDDGADALIGGLGKDIYTLIETTAATDTLVIAQGDSLIGSYDIATDFALGADTIDSTGVDKLDLANTSIAANVARMNGVDSGSIHSHSINNGIISFDDINTYTAPLTITAANLANVFTYLQANITGGNTVAFVSGSDSYVFQDGGMNDTLVELVGVTAHSINTSGLGESAVWIV
jgi:Ca2+-binding RTX toxin-like protein